MASKGAPRSSSKKSRKSGAARTAPQKVDSSASDISGVSASGFMHKYYDWAAFENFVKGLYEGDGETSVERDVTETDRYGATRQIDVKITRKTRFHKFVTIIECKRWKSPVSRSRIDILASTIEALGASNGAMFTTRGFEAGAVAYAKAKGIELFLVRDLTPEEWGLPGRHVSLTLHVNAGEFKDMQFEASAIMLVDGPPPADVSLAIDMSVKGPGHPDFDLFSVKTGERGPNLVDILGDAHGMLMNMVGKSFGVFDGGVKSTVELITPCEIDFTGTEFHQLRLAKIAARVQKIGMRFHAHVDQTPMHFDRGANLDFAVMVESFVSEQRLVAHRRPGDSEISFRDGAIKQPTAAEAADVFQNNSLLTVACARWIGVGEAVAQKSLTADRMIRVKVDVANGKPSLSLVAARYENGAP